MSRWSQPPSTAAHSTAAVQVRVHVLRQLGKPVAAARDGVPDDEVVPRTAGPEIIPGSRGVEEDAAVARVDGAPTAGDGVGQGRRGGGHEAGNPVVGAEEPQHRGRAVELPEPAAEAGVGDEAEPALADEGSVNEELGLFRGESEEDLVDEIIRQLRRRHGQTDAGGGARVGPRRRRE
uniref:Uncharacterized protein n=1 Tax=Setaria italica TaxID=4555 RepID=K4AIU0_SETIT